MARVVVYGASDDLVEVAGDLYEEYPLIDRFGTLTFSDGTAVKAFFDEEGQWRLEVTKTGPAVKVEHVPSREEDEGGRDEDGCSDYSDKLILEGPLESVKFRAGRRVPWASGG